MSKFTSVREIALSTAFEAESEIRQLCYGASLAFESSPTPGIYPSPTDAACAMGLLHCISEWHGMAVVAQILLLLVSRNEHAGEQLKDAAETTTCDRMKSERMQPNLGCPCRSRRSDGRSDGRYLDCLHD